ncbi:MAG: hypothetical protein WCY27_02780 [archaeon]|jgi:hypothetical protein|nr:hypothetical protein [archaeon]MDD2477913.1 hypothetical protein [Candidatus ainarchaeum sp.]MDD3084460.1 hypothetical protein [Candidatus ainarchaeum sp.]MDD4220922.1 hypothetical protein [Candidatus ainarchaeum sp.]MDD4662898.1 hypothetical protein [Candidatus ainarchaeum sp.]
MAEYLVKDSLNDFKNINKIYTDCQDLHITKAFSEKTFLRIYKKCTKLKLITVSKSTKERLSNDTKKLILKKRIKLYVKNEQGRPINISLSKLNKILEMYKDYSYRDLEEKLKIPKSTIHYLIKKSKKKKLKDGDKIIYLK